MNEAEARAAVVYLSSVDSRVTISKEITALAETWHHGLRDYTYDQTTWGIREYYGRLAVDNAPVLTAAQCRRILQNHKTVVTAKRQQLEPREEPPSTPMPEDLKRKLANIGLRPPETG